MYVVKETSYNIKGTFSIHVLNVYLIFNLERHLISYEIKCHFFIAITIMVRSNKMIVISVRISITKILFLIIIKPPFF